MTRCATSSDVETVDSETSVLPNVRQIFGQISGNDATQFLTLRLDRIMLDPELQPRAQIDSKTVDSYAEDLQQGDVFPPLVVYQEGDRLWLSEGWHRVHAAKKAGLVEFPCEVRAGGREEALLNSVGSNATHGLRRSNKDKRRAVSLLLNEPAWNERSDSWIASACGVSHTFVAKVHNQLETVTSRNERMGLDGKRRKLARPKTSLSAAVDADTAAAECRHCHTHKPDDTNTRQKCFEPDLPAVDRPCDADPDTNVESINALCSRIKHDLEMLLPRLAPIHAAENPDLRQLTGQATLDLTKGIRGVKRAERALKIFDKINNQVHW